MQLCVLKPWSHCWRYDIYKKAISSCTWRMKQTTPPAGGKKTKANILQYVQRIFNSWHDFHHPL